MAFLEQEWKEGREEAWSLSNFLSPIITRGGDVIIILCTDFISKVQHSEQNMYICYFFPFFEICQLFEKFSMEKFRSWFWCPPPECLILLIWDTSEFWREARANPPPPCTKMISLYVHAHKGGKMLFWNPYLHYKDWYNRQ